MDACFIWSSELRILEICQFSNTLIPIQMAAVDTMRSMEVDSDTEEDRVDRLDCDHDTNMIYTDSSQRAGKRTNVRGVYGLCRCGPSPAHDGMRRFSCASGESSMVCTDKADVTFVLPNPTRWLEIRIDDTTDYTLVVRYHADECLFVIGFVDSTTGTVDELGEGEDGKEFEFEVNPALPVRVQYSGGNTRVSQAGRHVDVPCERLGEEGRICTYIDVVDYS